MIKPAKTVISGEGINRWTNYTSWPEISRRSFLKGSMATLALPLLLGCNKSSTGPDPVFKLQARPGSPGVTPTIGRSELGLGEDRDGFLYIPESYSPETPAPLFVGLHGAGGTSDTFYSYQQRAEERGMILLVPESRSATWDMIRGSSGPDTEFLDRALQHTFDRCSIDPAHLALGGFSDGASYALSLGLSNGDLFSHILAYSPGFVNTPGPAVGNPRVYISHGILDNVLPVRLSRQSIVPYLINIGYDVTYNEFGGGHEVPAIVTETALDWFLDTV